MDPSPSHKTLSAENTLDDDGSTWFQKDTTRCRGTPLRAGYTTTSDTTLSNPLNDLRL